MSDRLQRFSTRDVSLNGAKRKTLLACVCCRLQALGPREQGDCWSMVICFLQAAAVCSYSSCTSAGGSLRFPPPSLPKLAPLVFAGQPAAVLYPVCPDDLPEAICLPERCRMPATLVDWTHNGLFQMEVLPRLGQRGVLFFPLWVHDVPQECRKALGTRLTKSAPANRRSMH